MVSFNLMNNIIDANNPKTKNPLKSNEKYGDTVVIKSLDDSSENF